MKIMQSNIPTGELLNKGLDVATCTMFQLGNILISDGAGGGKKVNGTILEARITANCGLILFAKDVETMLRGLSKIDQHQTVTGDGGLCVVAMHYSSSATISNAKKVGNFIKWSVERAKQSFIHDSYDIAQFFASVAKATILKNNMQRHDVHEKVQTRFANIGMQGKVSFATFKKNIEPKLKRKCSMIMVCLNKSMPLANSEGVTVIRNIRTHMNISDLRANAGRAFAGQGTNPFNGTTAIHEMDDWDSI